MVKQAETTISGGTPAFQITGAGVDAISAITRREANAFGASLALSKSRNTTPNNYTIVQDDDTLGSLIFIGDDGTNLDTYGATITAAVDGTPGANDMPARLTFSTTADGAASPTERMRIDSTGGVGIGSTDPSDTHLEVSGNTATKQSGMLLTMGGVGTGQTSDSYGIKINHQSNNSASTARGIYCESTQGVGGSTIGIYGNNHANSITQNSNTQGIGVFGQCVTNSAAVGYSPSRSDQAISAGVYGLVTQTGSSANQTSTAGHFRNACLTTASYGCCSYIFYSCRCNYN